MWKWRTQTISCKSTKETASQHWKVLPTKRGTKKRKRRKRKKRKRRRRAISRQSKGREDEEQYQDKEKEEAAEADKTATAAERKDQEKEHQGKDQKVKVPETAGKDAEEKNKEFRAWMDEIQRQYKGNCRKEEEEQEKRSINHQICQ